MLKLSEIRAAEIADSLRARIEAGEFKSGDYLPTSKDLMAEYKTYVNVIQTARNILVKQNLVIVVNTSQTRRGGTIVS